MFCQNFSYYFNMFIKRRTVRFNRKAPGIFKICILALPFHLRHVYLKLLMPFIFFVSFKFIKLTLEIFRSFS